MRSSAPTLDEVARAAGVSRSTASRAINGGNRVSPHAQAAVNEAIVQLGFTPNRAARALATQQTGSVALVIPEPDSTFLSDPFLIGVLRGVSEILATTETQLVLLVANHHRRAGQMARYLRAGHVDGAIVASPHRGDHLETNIGTRMPVVLIGRPFEEGVMSYVDVDNVAGGRMGTQMLIDAGRRRIGTVAGPLDMTAGLDRLRGWQEALEAAGMDTAAVAHADFTVPGARAATRALLTEHPDLDGIFVASDTMAVGVREVLDERGLSVPGDVALVGFDHLGVGDTMRPRLATVHNPLVDLVEAATTMLLDRIARPGLEPGRLILQPYVVPGDTM